MKMKKGHMDLVNDARTRIKTISIDEAKEMYGKNDVVFVDLRDVRELDREGMIVGAVHAPRGMLEFWVDPESPYHRDVFSSGKTFVFYCASGWRSSLATDAMQEMGLEPVCQIGEGFTGWRDAGGAVGERPKKQKPAEKEEKK